jgi:hypothetical protein
LVRQPKTSTQKIHFHFHHPPPAPARRPPLSGSTVGDSWREIAYLIDTFWDLRPAAPLDLKLCSKLIHVHSHTDDTSLTPSALLKFMNTVSDKTSEVIHLDENERVQDEPKFASRPRWSLEVRR